MANIWRTAPSSTSSPKLDWFFSRSITGETWPQVADDFFDAAPAVFIPKNPLRGIMLTGALMRVVGF